MDALITLIMGCVVISVATIAAGGAFLLSSHDDQARTPVQTTFFRAGHAHAGILVTLGLLLLVVQRSSAVATEWQWASTGVLFAAILMPLGFFLSVWPSGSTKPNRWILSIWAGAALLVVSVVLVGISLILKGASGMS